MSASTEPAQIEREPVQAWRPAGLLLLAIMLAGLAIGLWHESALPPAHEPTDNRSPVLQILSVALVAFFLVTYPLVLLWRARRPIPSQSYWRAVLPESAMFGVVAGVFLAIAAFLADAAVLDVARTVLYLLALLPLTWLAGLCFHQRRRGTWLVLLGLILAAAGLPAAWYVSAEFFPPRAAGLLGQLSPAMLAWRTAESRLDAVLPDPLWAWGVWPALALAGYVGLFAYPPRAIPLAMGFRPADKSRLIERAKMAASAADDGSDES